MFRTRRERLDSSRAAVEERTQRWLESSYHRALTRLANRDERVWHPTGNPRHLTRYHFQEAQRKLKVFRRLDQLHFRSLLDVGSGFDVYPALVRERYGVPAYSSDFVHAFNLPFGGAASGKLDRAITLNAARLPFADGTFDVVLASEVLEHLIRPVETIAEFLRVSRKWVVMTSLEALSPNAWRRFLSRMLVDVRKEHVERNFFLMQELEALFGPHWHHENLLHDPTLPASAFAPALEQETAYAAIRDVESLVAALCRAAAVEGHPPGSMGIVLLKGQEGADLGASCPETEADLCRWLISRAAAYEGFLCSLAADMVAGKASLVDRDRPVAEELCRLLRCPDCRAELTRHGGVLRCTGCSASFESTYGVPIMHPRTVPEDPEADTEALERICGDDSKRRAVVRNVMRRLRRNERHPGRLRRGLLGGQNGHE